MAGTQDEEAFAEYAAGALARLRRIAFLLCQDWHRADDLTQNALTRLYVHWRRAGSVENLDAYVGTILFNAYLSEQRTSWWKRTHVRPEPGELRPAAGTAAEIAADGDARVEEILDLRAALHTLAPRRRAVIVLRYYCDHSIEQTAQILNCSTGTVKSQTSRALAQLRETLASPAPDASDSDAADAAEAADAAPARPSPAAYHVAPIVPGGTK
jgi:RNA polymerase sigma-70 factor (sigma-E family)